MKYLLIKVDPEEYKKYISLINPNNIIRTYDNDPGIIQPISKRRLDKDTESENPALYEYLYEYGKKHGHVDLPNGVRVLFY